MSLPLFLQRCPLFAGLSEALTEALAAASETQFYTAGQTIVFRGTTLDGLYLVNEGAVSIMVKNAEVAKLGEHDCFGEMSLLSHGTAIATVKAGPEGARLIWIPEQAFLAAVAGDPALKSRAEAIAASRSQSPLGDVHAR